MKSIGRGAFDSSVPFHASLEEILRREDVPGRELREGSGLSLP